MTCLLCHFIRPDVERDIWMHFCSLHIQRHENSNAIWQCIDIECNVSRYVRICAHYVENSMSHKWLSLHIYSPTPCMWKRKKRQRERVCTGNSLDPWDTDRPSATYEYWWTFPDVLARPHLNICYSTAIFLFSFSYIFSQINFSKPLRHLVKPFFQFLRSFSFLSIQ